jgi:hypothetical protein
MTAYFVFNGDADGICALTQLRLASPGPGVLVTGVKRDIALVSRVNAAPGDHVTVLDVSLDVNREGLTKVLEAGAQVRYFDHHFAGEVPAHAALEAHLDPAPDACTSILVDRYLDGRHGPWAVVGAFGDSLDEPATALAETIGLSDAERKTLKDLGVTINYNAYGETVADLHVPPAELAAEALGYENPLDLARSSATYRRLSEGYKDDMDKTKRLEPFRKAPGAVQFLLPGEPWARRVSGTLANQLARAHSGNAVALLSPKTEGGFLVSVRVPETASTSAETFCRRFPTGGGRRTAAGINDLGAGDVEKFMGEFERCFSQG